MKVNDKKLVALKLLFGTTLEKQIKSNFGKIGSDFKTKKKFP